MSNTNFTSRLSNFIINFFTLNGQLVPQEQAEADIREGVSFRGTNIIILVLAILIASLGLNTNSTAVIIGAMLISPLMGPIIGIGLGVGIHDYQLVTRSLRNLIMAAGFSVIASTLYFLISPVAEGHSELLARTSPTIYDVLIGFVGGGAGILAIGSRSKGNVIPGVAIATALMPPLCTAGYGIATWQLNYFFGAFYLFLINSIYIALATFIGVKLMKYKGSDIVNNVRAQRVQRIVYVIALLTLLPSIYLTYNMLRQNKFEMNATRFVNHVCNFPSTQVLNSRAYELNGERVLSITLIGRILPTDSLELALSRHLADYDLKGVHLDIIQGDASVGKIDLDGGGTGAVRDIYQLAQNTISRQQQTIDSMRSAISESEQQHAQAIAITPEIRVLFPEITAIAVTRHTIFSKINGAQPDTLNLALVHFTSPMTAAQRTKFSEYLEARLQLHPVKIVEVNRSIFDTTAPNTDKKP